MKHRKYFVILLIIIAMGVTACSGITSGAPVQDVSNVPVQSSDQQSPQGQSHQNSVSVPQAETPLTGDAGSGASEAISSVPGTLTYPIVDTDQSYCYSDNSSISCPEEGQAFYGQDAQYTSNTPRYQDNGDGTVTDLVTGLMWQQDPGEKMTYDQAVAGASSFTLAGYTDWRLPSIKELYSLIQFSGTDASVCMMNGSCGSTPFIDTETFHFEYGDTNAGERIIDSQWATSNVYTGIVFGGQQAMFGVNFADGRIKGYPTNTGPGGAKTFFVLYVRGNTSYGINDFVDDGNGTITDHATGLTWTQNDSGQGLDWEGALNYCASLDYAGISDWRLPNAKELQSIVDYSRSPDATDSAAIDPIFNLSTITDEAGQLDYPAFWSSTTHLSANGGSGAGVYVTFGRALGYMNNQWMDVHGAGAQRAEDKSGDPSQYPTGHGPQGDAVRIYNYVRCVTGGTDGDVQVGGAVDNTPLVQDQPPSGQAPQGQGGQGPQDGGQPPQEAIDACSGLSQGAACTMDTLNGTLTGSCMTVQTGQLACVPAGGPPQ
jgi:hypothetical protein